MRKRIKKPRVILRKSREAYLMPRVAKVVAISVSHGDKCLYGVDVLLLHFCDAGAGCQQGEASKGLNIGISFQLEEKPKRAL